MKIDKQEGDFKPWWDHYQIEAYGWTSKTQSAETSGGKQALQQIPGGWSTTVAANPRGETVRLY